MPKLGPHDGGGHHHRVAGRRRRRRRRSDQPIMLIETDKTETEVGAPGQRAAPSDRQPGDVFACGELIGVILADGETAVRHRPPHQPRWLAARRCRGRPHAPDSVAGGSAPVGPAAGRLFASPNARRVAAERGVALRTVRGHRARRSDRLRGRAAHGRQPMPRRGSAAFVAHRSPRGTLPICSVSTSPACPPTRSSAASPATASRCTFARSSPLADDGPRATDRHCAPASPDRACRCSRSRPRRSV